MGTASCRACAVSVGPTLQELEVCSSSGACMVNGLKAAHLFLSALLRRCLLIERTNRPGRAQCFKGFGFILFLHGLSVLLSPLTKASDLLEDLKISTEIHQHPLQGTQLSFALSQANTSIFATKADSRKVELQEKNVTSLPSVPRRPQPVVVGSPLELYLRDFTWQLLWALHVETCAP